MRCWPLLLFFCTSILAQNAGRYPALLWKISGNGLKKSSYLYGTMHVSNKVAWHLSEQFFDALQSVEVVGLETNPADWLLNMEATGELKKISHPIQNFSFQSNFYENVFKWDFPDRKVLQAILSYDPDIINGLLYRKSSSKDNFEENTYVDLFIFQTASKLGKKVISLENFEAAEVQAKLANEPDENEEAEFSNRFFHTGGISIEDAYREGNLDLLDSLSHQSTSKNTQKYLIEARNVYFANSIDSVLKTSTLFSGVGAAHLPGKNGLIELLRKKGYTLEPIFGKTSRQSEKEKIQIDQIDKPLVFSKQTSNDSLFSIDLPGKLYTIYESPALSYQIQPDMINGHFFTIVRMRHYGAIYGYSALDMKARIDSLLFEGIAGRIIEKNELLGNTGMPGIEVLAKTANGDEQRYQIYFDDNEMYLFKLGAKSNYASSKSGSAYFKSISFAKESSVQTTFQPPTGGFKIELNGKCNYQFISGASIGLVEDLINSKKGNSLFVQHVVYNDFNYLEEDTFELIQLSKNILENYHYQLESNYTFHTTQGLPSIRFQSKNEKGQRLDGKIIINGVHYYLVLMVTARDTEPNYQNFDSFLIQDFKFIHPFKKIVDTDFLFSVEDEVSNDAASRFEENFQRERKTAFAKKDTTHKRDVGFRSDVKQYYSPSSNEFVQITFEKYNYYDYRKKSELIKKIDQVYAAQTSMCITGKKVEGAKDQLHYQFILKDTATSRAIFVKLYFQNSTLHELSAAFDTTQGLKGWTKNFFLSFTPLDSATGPSCFEPKAVELFCDLQSADSTKKAEAKQALEEISFGEEYLDPFLQFLQSEAFSKLEESAKSQLLVNGGTLQSDDLIGPYRTLYQHYEDSLFLQLSVLKGLAYSKTSKSAQAFFDLIYNSPPLSGDENIIYDLFSVFNDSLQLCERFFPDLLNLTRYEEYKNPVMALLSTLLEKNRLPPENLKKSLSFLIADANLVLRRMAQTRQLNKESGNPRTNDLTAILKYNVSEEVKSEITSVDLSDRMPILNYVSALAPFYTTDLRAKSFLDKTLQLKELEVVIPTLVEVSKYASHVNDSLFDQLCSSAISKAIFFHQLKQADLLDRFPTSTCSQEDLVRSLIKSKTSSQNFSYLTERQPKDSLFFIGTLPVKNRYQKGLLYLYRNGNTSKMHESWRVAYVADHTGKLSDQIVIMDQLYYLDPRKSEQENMNELQNRFYLLHRGRVRALSPF